MSKKLHATSIVLVLLMLATACTGDDATDSASPAPEAPAASGDAVTLKVMSFNVRYGGTYGYEHIVEAIEAAEADVVGIQEAAGKTRQIAEDLGGWYAAPRLQIVSRFPILEPPESSSEWGAGIDSKGRWAYIEVAPGRYVTMMNTHLPCCPYGPYRIARKDVGLKDVLKGEESRRGPAIREQLRAAQPVIDLGLPSFMTGDYNQPSPRDWTADAVAARDDASYPVVWPATQAMEDAGYTDSFRAVHPDAVAKPGITWTPGNGPDQIIKPDEVLDRIDFVWAFGDATPVDSAVVGENGSEYTDIGIDQWPSDHRAVVSTFEVVPGPAEVFVAPLEYRVEQGQSLEVAFHAPGEEGETVEAACGTDPSATATEATGGEADGTVTLATDSLSPGTCEVRLNDADGQTLSANTFWLLEPGAEPSVQVNASSYRVGQPISVSWENGPGNRYDWIMLSHPGANEKRPWSDWGNDKVWTFIDAHVAGTTELNDASHGRWPMAPGTYIARLCLDDDFTCMATSKKFTIEG